MLAGRNGSAHSAPCPWHSSWHSTAFEYELMGPNVNFSHIPHSEHGEPRGAVESGEDLRGRLDSVGSRRRAMWGWRRHMCSGSYG